MNPRWQEFLLAVSTMLALVSHVSGQETGIDAFQSKLQPLLSRYCIDCHSQESAEGGISFDSFSSQMDAVQGGELWLRVLDAIEGRVMPPVDSQQPTTQEIEQAIGWIETDFFADLCRSQTAPSPVVIRRLNRVEYENTINDLLAVDLVLADSLPPDEIAFGFDNIGSALNVSPIHVEKYFSAAEQAINAAIAVPNADEFPPIELIGLRTHPLPPTETVQFEHELNPGRYIADLSLVRVGIAETVEPPRLVIGLGTDRRTVQAMRWQDETVVYRCWLSVADDDRQVSVSLAPEERNSKNVVDPNAPIENTSGDKRYGNQRGLHVDSLVVRGPVPIVGQEASRAGFDIDRPNPGENTRLANARRVVERFAGRAFRRPVDPSEVDRLMGLFEMALNRGECYERALQVAFTSVLVSPEFLYLVEPHQSPGSEELLSEFELASRLSYFLWSTMPDDELFQQALHGQLRANLRQQIDRMLEHSKANEFVRNFTGQWLQLRKLEDVAKDQQMFPEFDKSLRDDMRKETEHFFADILSRNGSILEFLDADYTYVNDNLSRHYGLNDHVRDGRNDHVQGDFQRVQLDDQRRGGLLTQASILTLTSNPNRTSPVKRGQWILQQLLGTPPPPPPPDVEDLDESPTATKAASLRERLEIHRSNPECAGCHNQMDPLGFALENYDAIGRWRDYDGDFEIDASGSLSGGRDFQNAGELKRLLKETDRKKFSRCLVEAMLTYALGRGLELGDRCTVEEIRGRVVDSGFQIREIIYGITESSAFQSNGVLRREDD